MSWKSIIRFRDASGKTQYGEPDETLKSVTVYEGDSILSLEKTDSTAEVVQILAPYVPDTILCIGANYREHINEAGMKLPSYPVVFHKSKNSITGPYDDVKIPKQAEGSVDYENELSFVVSKDVKDVSVEDAPGYILGYTIGNDISARSWQIDPAKCGGQFSYAKNFDAFCPIGPAIVAPEVVGDPQKLKIETRRGGKVVQSSSTSDMIFGVYEILSFLSQGTTVPAGSLVLTGTPPGVAVFASKPPKFIQPGEVVECEVEKLGVLSNKFV